MAPKLSQVCFKRMAEDGSFRRVLEGELPCSLQEEFDEAVKTNIEDFDMEVIMLLLFSCGLAPPYQRAFTTGSQSKTFLPLSAG